MYLACRAEGKTKRNFLVNQCKYLQGAFRVALSYFLKRINLMNLNPICQNTKAICASY